MRPVRTTVPTREVWYRPDERAASAVWCFLPIAIVSGVFDPTFSGLPNWLSRLVAAFPVKPLAQVLQNAYAARPFSAWDLVNLGLWTAAGRFRWHS